MLHKVSFAMRELPAKHCDTSKASWLIGIADSLSLFEFQIVPAIPSIFVFFAVSTPSRRLAPHQ